MVVLLGCPANARLQNDAKLEALVREEKDLRAKDVGVVCFGDAV